MERRSSSEYEDGVREVHQPDEQSEYVEVCFAESEKQMSSGWETCMKNPGHKDFIPVDTFTMEHLPSQFRDNNVLDLVKAMADITVLLKTCYISVGRPETHALRICPFPLHKLGGKIKISSGTGRVTGVDIYDNEPVKNCMHEKCQGTENTKTFARIKIRTAAHVVFDQSEAEVTTCFLWHDGLATKPPTKICGFRMNDWKGQQHGEMIDMVLIVHETHDLELAEKVKAFVGRYKEAKRRVQEIYRHVSNSLVILVSHPHGQTKYVSIGNSFDIQSLWNFEDLVDYGLNVFAACKYNAPTCPGSSGASFRIVGCYGLMTNLCRNVMCHRSGLQNERGFNRGSLMEVDWDDWYLRKQIIDYGVEPRFSEPVVLWYINSRKKILQLSKGKGLKYKLQRVQALNSKIRAESEEEFLELLNKVPTMDLTIREHLSELALKWRRNLQQLCGDLQVSIGRLLAAVNSRIITEDLANLVFDFLNFDQDQNGQLDYCSFRSLLICVEKDKSRKDQDFQAMGDKLKDDSSRVSLSEFTDLLLKYPTGLLHDISKDRLCLQAEAVEQGVEPEFSEPIVSWYSEIRFELLQQPASSSCTLKNHLKACKKLNAKIRAESEEEFLKLLDKVPSADVNIRRDVQKLAVKWRQELQELCRDLKLSLKRMMTERRADAVTEDMVDDYQRCLKYFLDFDQNRNGKLDHDSFKSLVTRLCDEEWIREGDWRLHHIQAVLDGLDSDRTRRVSLFELTDLLLKLWNKNLVEDRQNLQQKARAQGIDPKLFERMVSWYSEARFKLVHQPFKLKDRLEACKMLNAEFLAESEEKFLVWLNKVPLLELDIRGPLCEHALKWRRELQQLCQDLELCLKRVKEAKDSRTITKDMAKIYLSYLKDFLHRDKNWNGKLDCDSFRSLMTDHGKGGLLMEKSCLGSSKIILALCGLDSNKICCVSLLEFTVMMLSLFNSTWHKDSWFLQTEAKEQGVELEFSVPLVSSYSKIRSKLLEKPCPEAIKLLNAKFRSESEEQILELLNKVPAMDSNIRKHHHELVLKWRQELEQLCQFLEPSLERVINNIDRKIYRKDVNCYWEYVNEFLDADKNRNCKLDSDSFKSLMTHWRQDRGIEKGDVRDQYIKAMIDSLDSGRTNCVSLIEFTDLLLTTYHRKLAEDRWYFQTEAKEQGVEPVFSEPLVSWYSEIRFKLLEKPSALEQCLQITKKLNTEITSECDDKFLELLNKVPSADSNIRERLGELALTWRRNLHQLCQNLELSLKLMMEVRDRNIIETYKFNHCLTYQKVFLGFDKSRQGKINSDDFKSLMARWREKYSMREGEARNSYIQTMVDSLDNDRTRDVSLLEYTDLLLKTCSQKLAEELWFLQSEAKEQGVEPEFSDPIVWWYTETSFNLLQNSRRSYQSPKEHLEACKELSAKMTSESEEEFLELLNKVPSTDSNIRKLVGELALKWRRNLQALCHDLELSLEQVIEAKDRNSIQWRTVRDYRACLEDFLVNYLNGRPGLDCFKSLMTGLCYQESVTEGDSRHRYIQTLIDKCDHDRTRRVSLMEFTNLLFKICDTTLHKEYWFSQREAVEQGVEPEFSEPFALWYSETRFQSLHEPVTLKERMEAVKLLNDQIRSESEEKFLERLNKDPSPDLSIRESVWELARKWRCDLQQLCQDLELSLERVMEASECRTITHNMEHDYLRFLTDFLNCDENRNGKLGYDSFKSLMSGWCSSELIKEKSVLTDHDMEAVLDSLDCDRIRSVSLVDFTDLLLPIWDRCLAEDYWFLLKEAVKHGVEYNVIKPAVVWYSEIRDKFLLRADAPEGYLHTCKDLGAVIASEERFLEMLNKVPSVDPTVRQCVHELSLKWRHELQEVCEELELCLKQLLEARQSRSIAEFMVHDYGTHLRHFLNFDKSKNGKLDYDSLKSLMMLLRNKEVLKEGDTTDRIYSTVVDNWDHDRTHYVSLTDFTNLLLKHAPGLWQRKIQPQLLPLPQPLKKIEMVPLPSWKMPQDLYKDDQSDYNSSFFDYSTDNDASDVDSLTDFESNIDRSLDNESDVDNSVDDGSDVDSSVDDGSDVDSSVDDGSDVDSSVDDDESDVDNSNKKEQDAADNFTDNERDVHNLTEKVKDVDNLTLKA